MLISFPSGRAVWPYKKEWDSNDVLEPHPAVWEPDQMILIRISDYLEQKFWVQLERYFGGQNSKVKGSCFSTLKNKMHVFSVHINTGKTSSDRNHRKSKSTHLHLFLVHTICFKCIRIRSPPFSVGFTWLEMKKSRQAWKKIPGVFFLVDFSESGH